MLLALIAFVVLLVTGAAMGELAWPHVVGWVLVAAGVLATVAVLHWPFAAFCGVIVLMDAVLIIVIFKGDIRIR